LWDAFKLPQPQLHLRLRFAPGRDAGPQHAGKGGRGCEADAYDAPLAPSREAPDPLGTLNLRQGRACLAEKYLTRIRQRHETLGAPEQPGAQKRLQSLHLFGQGWRRDAEPLSSPGEMQRLGDGQKGAQMSKFQTASFPAPGRQYSV
jgi:hypothetical protein